MKHFLRDFLCLALSLAFMFSAAPALAAQGPNADFFLTQLALQEQGYGELDYPQSAVAVGDTLYIQTDQALYRWKSGMEEPENLLSFRREETEGEDAAQTPDPSATADPLAEVTAGFRSYFSKLLTDGKRLLILNLQEGALWQLTDEGGALAPVLENTLDFSAFKSPEGDYSYPDIRDIELMDGQLYLVAVDYERSDSAHFYRWELASGKAGEPLPCQITSTAAYKDGRLLCLLMDSSEWNQEREPEARLAIFDPKTNAFEELFPAGKYDCVGLSYNPENDTAYYMEGTVLRSLPGLALPAKKSAYFINRVWDNIGCGLMQGGLYYQASSDGVSIRALDLPGLENGALSIYGSYASAPHLAFASQHPEIPTSLSSDYFDSLEAFANAMVSGQDAVDVLRLYVSNTPMGQLIDKGYALDLSGNADVMAAVNEMYPAFVDSFRRDGKVYALPVEVYASSIGYFQAVLRDLGLTREDLPKTWMELLDFIANWQQDYGEDHAGVHLMDNRDLKDSLLYLLMENYVAYSLKTWGKIDFATPLFAKLMGAYDAIDFEELESSMGGEEDQDAFWNEKHLLSFYADYTQVQYRALEREEETWLSTPLPLPLDEGLEVVIPATESVMIINPRTTRLEQAQLYLSTFAQYYDKASSNITLFPEHNEPVPNLNFEADVSASKTRLERVQKALESAPPEEKASLEEEEKYLQSWLANAEASRYTVREEAIAEYRENIAPYLYPMSQTPLNTWRNGKENELYTLMRQYKEGAIPLDRFIKEIGNRVRMMELENQ
ncbi:MAG: extracellular solute-binding protein [Candidatus Limiplasma sp.]|nr:extracellular solute-binding protein [Candidatus Limiplasma sp.]